MNYKPPDEIVIYHNGRYKCAAFATDSERGRSIPREEIADTQRRQKQEFREIIKDAVDEVEKAENQTDTLGKGSASGSEKSEPQSISPSQEVNITDETEDEEPDVFDLIAKRWRDRHSDE